MTKKPGRQLRRTLAGPVKPTEHPLFTINKHKLEDPEWRERLGYARDPQEETDEH